MPSDCSPQAHAPLPALPREKQARRSRPVSRERLLRSRLRLARVWWPRLAQKTSLARRSRQKMPLARVSRQRPHTFFPDAGRKILCRWLAAVPRVLQGPSCAGRPICGPSSAAPIADTTATAAQKTRFAADAAEAFDKQNCVPCAKTMAACSRVQFAPAHIPPACRSQLQTGKPFRKHGNPDICQCARRSLRSHAHRPAPPESFEKCGLAESPAPDAKAGKLDNDSGRVRNARIAHNPRKQDAVPESCFV